MSKENGKNRLHLSITLSDDDRTCTCRTEYDDGVSWDKLLKDVANAFHGYGYIGVDEKVFVMESFAADDDALVKLQEVSPFFEEDNS